MSGQPSTPRGRQAFLPPRWFIRLAWRVHRAVRARAATPEERPRLWARWAEYNGEQALESWAARRSRETAVVIFEPRA